MPTAIRTLTSESCDLTPRIDERVHVTLNAPAAPICEGVPGVTEETTGHMSGIASAQPRPFLRGAEACTLLSNRVVEAGPGPDAAEAHADYEGDGKRVQGPCR